MKTTRLNRGLLMVLALCAALTWGCRRDADDKGVGTSSVGAGGANGAAPNNDRKAQPVPGTTANPSQETKPAAAPDRPASDTSDAPKQ